jgi:hypothetical protein
MVQKTAVRAQSAALTRAGSRVRARVPAEFSTKNIRGKCCPPKTRAAATKATAQNPWRLIDTLCRLKHDPSRRKQRLGTTSNRHSRRRVPVISHSPLITSHCRLPVTVSRVERDATHCKQRTAAHSTRHSCENLECAGRATHLQFARAGFLSFPLATNHSPLITCSLLPVTVSRVEHGRLYT